MKKLMITLTMVLGVTAYVAADSVTTGNVLGYVKTPAPAAGNADIISIASFGTNDTVNIQDAIMNLEDLNASTAEANADKIIVWDGTGYTTYGLFDDGGTNSFWMKSGTGGWIFPDDATPANVALSRQDAVWFQTGTGGTANSIVTSGSVRNDQQFDVQLGSGATILAYPFTSSINLTNLVVSNATASVTEANADKITVWDGSGYTKYGLFDDGGTNSFWMKSGTGGWIFPEDATPTSAELPLGKGFWYESVDGAKTVGFEQIYTLSE